MKTVNIINKTGEVMESHVIDNDVIVRACGLTVEIHNRDNPDDPWTVRIDDPDSVQEIGE